MTHYSDEAAAELDGYEILAEPEQSRFVIRQHGDQVGVADYVRDEERGVSLFTHTFVDPAHRGTGLSALLVARAVPERVAAGDRIEASCWYVAEQIEANPALTRPAASPTAPD
ncbi:GNAT family N-acetyltransferase [Leucobacter sp. M11]|uniref:GNAT family N-acetyltransferase n=1 Tax=Leucobacter sp. M11 TaxID=2993565 RepID=UPI002D7F15F1|nr:GNAT family N-acetyltransferase [Leucobacter sp. M11]MEB4613427.1 GNAT family N-acetyltransferase [Leucobacter sp. M11]